MKSATIWRITSLTMVLASNAGCEAPLESSKNQQEAPSQAQLQSDIETLQKNRPRMSEIVSTVARPGGSLDSETHKEFWSLMPESVRDNPKSFIENLDIVTSMRYQKELWESVRLSARSRTVTKTLSYETARADALGNGAAGQDAADRANRMLVAAATRTPFQGIHGEQELSEEYANQVLDELNRSTERLQALSDPVWHEDTRALPNQSLSGSPPSENIEHLDNSDLADGIVEANRRLPMDVGHNTRLERISAGPNRRITYHFTLTNRTADDVTPAKISAGRAVQIGAACSSKSVQDFLGDGIAVTYEYKTADGANFTSLDITEALCLGASGDK